jgi:hypothetical protein
VGIFIIAALVVYAANSIRQTRGDTQSRVYRELALNVAKAGFEDGLSYFRRQPDGVYLDAYPAYAPTSQDWVTPWPHWPDAAFLPQATDTDHYDRIQIPLAQAVLAETAGGIVRTVPLTSYSNTPTSVERQGSRLWGRYVLRRQNRRNWSPGPNTTSAYSDPEAVHDLTHIRSEAKPGSGNYWSIFSRAYVFTHPTALTFAAAHEGGNLLSAPLRFYGGQRLLLATASVYGELFRINFNQPNAAVYVHGGNRVTCNTNGVINGQGNAAIARYQATAYNNGGGAVSGGYLGMPATPSVAYCFPGLDKARLKAMASSINPTKVGGIGVFPQTTDANFTDVVSRTSFYYVTTTGLAGNNLIFATGSPRVMSGVGLLIVDGNLTIQAGNQSAWAGVVFVDGNVSIRGPAEVSGTLIATGTVTVGNANDINKAFVEHNQDAIETVQSFLQNFRVLTNSVVASPK